MKKFTVNVHYDAVGTVTVNAESEEEALELANAKTELLETNEFDLVDRTGSCVTDIAEIDPGEKLKAVTDALDSLASTLKEQGVQLIFDRENGMFRLLPATCYLDDMDSHDLDADPSHDESEFDVIDPPILIYDNYYHGIFDKENQHEGN